MIQAAAAVFSARWTDPSLLVFDTSCSLDQRKSQSERIERKAVTIGKMQIYQGRDLSDRSREISSHKRSGQSALGQFVVSLYPLITQNITNKLTIFKSNSLHALAGRSYLGQGTRNHWRLRRIGRRLLQINFEIQFFSFCRATWWPLYHLASCFPS